MYADIFPRMSSSIGGWFAERDLHDTASHELHHPVHIYTRNLHTRAHTLNTPCFFFLIPPFTPHVVFSDGGVEGSCLMNTLQPGTALVCSGYCLYSSSCMFVLTMGAGTHGN